jgi:putative ABC transport system permease protein
MGFKQPVGELIKDGRHEWHVVGVIEDFILTSPDQKIKPMVLFGAKAWFTVIHIRLTPNQPIQASLDHISKLYSKYNPVYPFDYSFVDQDYAQKFASADVTLKITTIFSSIAIIIAGLGLLGLSTYIIEARLKEIGIRKVLGGSVGSIIALLSSTLLKPIVIAILVFSPMAWYSMNWWLQSFDYHITLSVWLILGAASSVLVLAFITTASQTFGAARLNPVETLRNE